MGNRLWGVERQGLVCIVLSYDPRPVFEIVWVDFHFTRVGVVQKVEASHVRRHCSLYLAIINKV